MTTSARKSVDSGSSTGTTFLYLAVACVVIARGWFVSTRRFQDFVGFVPDDAFYYLNLARHFDESERWTTSPLAGETTGFHLLYAYLLAGLHALLPETSGESAARIAVLFGAVVAAGAA